MNIIEDILEIIKNDHRHNIKIVMDLEGITIYLDDDPDDTYEERYVIPIRLDILYESCYIPDDEYKNSTEYTDYGIDKEEIDLIQKIMEYLENNKEEIFKKCDLLSRKQRKENS